jgi:hypothetical protein
MARITTGRVMKNEELGRPTPPYPLKSAHRSRPWLILFPSSHTVERASFGAQIMPLPPIPQNVHIVCV